MPPAPAAWRVQIPPVFVAAKLKQIDHREIRITKMRKYVTPIIAAIFLVALAACTAGQPEPDTQKPAPIATATALPTRAAKPEIAPSLQGTPTTVAEAQSGEATMGGVFTRNWADPPTLDPHLVTDTTSAGVVVEIFSGLVSLNQDLEIVPELAESWSISGGGTVYEFTLRKDLKFSNGEPVTTEDFRWSLERAAHPDTESPVAEIYLGDILGINEIIKGRGDVTSAEGIEVIDERTLRLTIDGPKAYFLAKLTYPTAYVLDRENVESGGDTWTDNAAGTGPFFLEEYRIGQRMVLARNENYWGRKAYLDNVVMNLAGGVSMSMYENDEIDITGVGLADVNRVQDPSEELNKDLIRVPPQFSVSYIGFNVNEPPFDDRNFRRALNFAVDKETIAEHVYSGLVRPAYGIIPPGFPGFSEEIDGIHFNVETAKNMLAESKYADPETRPRITVTIPGTGGLPGRDVQVVKDMWSEHLGVEIEIQQVEWATYLQDLNRSRLQAWGGLGWEADYPDPQDFIDILFYSESPGNHGAYGNDDVDRLVEQARTEQDVIRRVQLYNEAEQLILDDAAWLPMWFDTEGLALIKPWVHNYAFTPIITPKLKNVYIQK